MNISLTFGEVALDGVGDRVIKLLYTKNVQRHAAFQATTILDPMVAHLLDILMKRLPKGTQTGHYMFAGPSR